jgi:hypothetical protein
MKDVDEPIYGVTVFDGSGTRTFVTNNMWIQQKVNPVKAGEIVTASWVVPNIFNSGTFSIEPAVAGAGGSVMFDQVEDAVKFKVRKKAVSNALVNVTHKMIVRTDKA